MKIFGTDGVRGIVGNDLNLMDAFKVGKIIGKGKKILVGKDTRLSGDILLKALTLGVLSVGGEILDLGIVPTPCVSFLTKRLNYDFGVMITASHNPKEYNGIKIFDKDGYKISNKIEEKIERDFDKTNFDIEKIGSYSENFKKSSIYSEFLLNSVKDLSGLKILVDCANGANYKIAPEVFKKVGLKIKAINNKNNGEKINNNCGALHIEKLKDIKGNYDLKIAFDGDADRIMAMDSFGRIIDGDRILLMLAKVYQKENNLNGNRVVSTKMSNLKVLEELQKDGVSLIQTDVGDKNLSKAMRDENLILGAEQSGHIILGEYLPTGDGLLAGIKLCEVFKFYREVFDEVMALKFYPQFLENFKISDKSILKNQEFSMLIKNAEKKLKEKGRIYVRASGTEPKLRVLIETNDQKVALKILKDVRNLVKKLER